VIRTWIRALAIGLLVLTVASALLVAAAWTLLPLDGVAIKVHGETFSLADLQGTQAGLFFLLAVAAVVIAVLAALAMLVVGLALGAFGIVVGLLATAGSLALVVAPIALVGWGLWRLFRARPATPPVGAATP
jgi:hypothetical protein